MLTKKLQSRLLGTEASNDDEKYKSRTLALFGQMEQYDVEVGMPNTWAKRMEAFDGTLLQLRDAACDERARATNERLCQ